MSSYRCCFLDAANHVAADRFVEGGTDGLAQVRAPMNCSRIPRTPLWNSGMARGSCIRRCDKAGIRP